MKKIRGKSSLERIRQKLYGSKKSYVFSFRRVGEKTKAIGTVDLTDFSTKREGGKSYNPSKSSSFTRGRGKERPRDKNQKKACSIAGEHRPLSRRKDKRRKKRGGGERQVRKGEKRVQGRSGRDHEKIQREKRSRGLEKLKWTGRGEKNATPREELKGPKGKVNPKSGTGKQPSGNLLSGKIRRKKLKSEKVMEGNPRLDWKGPEKPSMLGHRRSSKTPRTAKGTERKKTTKKVLRELWRHKGKEESGL